MNERLNYILSLVIDKAVKTGEPVGSQALVDHYNLEFSPATIRNYFAELEKNEYIMQPHTSSGRLPTEKGYRYHVENTIATYTLSRKEVSDLNNALLQQDDDHRSIKSLAKEIAELVQNAAIVGIGNNDSFYTGLSNLFAQPEFKDWNRIVSLSDVLDKMDDVLAKLRSVRFDRPTVLIGSDCPFGSLCGSVIVSIPPNYMIGILGPMRMDYAQAVSVMKKIQELIAKK